MANSRTCARFGPAEENPTDNYNDTTYHAVPWDIIFMDSIYTHDGENHPKRIGITEDGKYLVAGSINYRGTTGSYRFTSSVGFSVNGGTVDPTNTFMGAYVRAYSESTVNGCSFTTILDLSAGDYLEIKSKRISGTSGNVVLANGTNVSIMRCR